MYNVLPYATLFIGLLPLSFYLLLHNRKTSGKRFQSFIPFLWILAIGSVCQTFFIRLFGVDPQQWLRVYDLLEFISLYMFFRKLLPHHRYKLLLRILLAVFLGGIVFVYRTDMSPIILESVYQPFSFLFVFLLSSVWLYNVFILAESPSLSKISSFYFISGFIFYYTITFFLYLYAKVIHDMEDSSNEAYDLLNTIAVFILSISLITGILKSRNEREERLSHY